MNMQSAVPSTFPKSVQPGIPRLGTPPDGWRTVKLGDILEAVSRPVVMQDNDEYRLLTVRRSRGGLDERAVLRGRDIAVKSQFRVCEGDFLISKRQIVHGACGVVPRELAGSVVSNEYAVLRPKEDLNIDFLRLISHSIYFQQTCFHSSIGVHIEKMLFKLDQWMDWVINIPSLAEQQRIAEGHGALEGKIRLLVRKKDALTRFKTGLMQKLFSREIRFTREDGSAFPEWESCAFSEIADRVTAGFDPRKDANTPSLIELENLESGTGRILGHGDLSGQISLKHRFQAGDVLFGKLRPYLRKFARPGFDGVYSSEIWVLRGKTISNEFLHHLVQTDRFMGAVNLSSGSKMPRAEWSLVAAAEFDVPSPEEQTKIADALSALDDKIAAVADQITQMETFKKGLLQQMFV